MCINICRGDVAIEKELEYKIVPYQIRREPLASMCRFVKKNLSVEEARAVILDRPYTVWLMNAAGSRLI